ncbi:FecCD family ABC transporter permease [Limimaricola pyoseonensis]|uniref:Iron complex transport system permease protein n=1 Tax=Limimaricola pyoseonensis TaxID=521013 RepID=A0A1G7I6W5_9RHOB|nr:iron ABC transporter permease [Limimaricola pyoseonensis]SDF08450.1 iron complex transport system permease protein [Limimaricola pyoseonensis]
MTRPALLLLALLPLLALASLQLGLTIYGPGEVWAALRGAEGQDALIIRTLRLPRTVLALLVGAALGLCGLLMQSATRNPIAEPGLLGVNAGAALAVVLGVSLLGLDGIAAMTLMAAAGAVAATVLVFGLALAGGPNLPPAHLLLAGVTLSALLWSGTQVVILLDEAAMEELLFWLSGAFADRPLAALPWALPPMAAIAVLALLATRRLDVLRTDDGTAEALGVPVRASRLAALVAAALLAGCAVALAGPIAFLGLVAPHLAQLAGARDHRALVPLTMLCGAVLALVADIAARHLIAPSEAPISAVTALAGAPVLLALLRRRRLGTA